MRLSNSRRISEVSAESSAAVASVHHLETTAGTPSPELQIVSRYPYGL
jgi:hypothetical protein